MYQSVENISIERRFVNLSSRQVHYRVSGSGPILVLLHQSPTSSAEMASVIEQFSDEFTVIAPDTPGFGLSDFVDDIKPDITEYAEALKEFLDALAIDKACFYGFHTGAIIATELARLYPDLCNVVVVNGLVVLEPEEEEEILAHYTKWFSPTPEGGQMPWIWSRIRDQLIFFPWFKKEASSRMALDLPPPEFLQPYVLDLVRSNAESQTAYKAAFLYPSRDRIKQLKIPTYLINYEGDPIADHPKRLDNLPENVVIELLPDPIAVEQRSRDIFKEHSVNNGEIKISSSVDLESGKQGFVPTTYGPLYYCSEGEDKENIVLVLHDLGESSKSSRRYSEGIKNASLKLMIDLPGHGETGPSHLSNYSPQSMARMIREALKNLKVERISVLAVGGSLPIALRLAESRELSVDRLAALDPWFLNDQEKEEFKESYIPDITPTSYGEHLLKAWYFARDSELYFPWYKSQVSSALGRLPDIEAESVHNKAIELLKGGDRLQLVTNDLLGYDFEEDLINLSMDLTVLTWQGNLRDVFASRMAKINDRIIFKSLPENRNEWTIEI